MLLRLCPGGRNGTIGLVGYPNVGKSSTVNVLVAEKKTSVSSTPGKTKHFQTLHVPDQPGMVLCDCPGLVFPTVAGSKAQMVCDGILPIDQLKSDYMPPIRLLCERLPPECFEQCYTLKLRTDEERAEDPDMPELARELLVAHALARGFFTATKGVPDESRSSRIILKDVVNAKLLYVVPPPGGESQTAARGRKKVPSVPTTTRYLTQMKADFEAQEGVRGGTGSASRGGKKKSDQRGQAAIRSMQMQWRPTGTAAMPDRIVASGPRVDLE